MLHFTFTTESCRCQKVLSKKVLKEPIKFVYSINFCDSQCWINIYVNIVTAHRRFYCQCNWAQNVNLPKKIFSQRWGAADMTSGNLNTQMYSVFCRGPVSMSALCNVSLYTKRQKTVCHHVSVSTHRNPARAEWTLDARRVSDTVPGTLQSPASTN